MPILAGRCRTFLVRVVVAACVVLPCLAPLPARAAGDAADDVPKTALTGDAKCTRCHDEEEAAPVLAILATRHGVKADARTPTCQGCHGESTRHLSKPGGVRPPSEVGYGPKTTTPIAKQNETCLACHQGRRLIHWQGSIHDTREVACTGCHRMHAAHDPVMAKETQPQTCFACHKEQRALFNKPSHHPVLEGRMACSDCHNSHGTAGVRLLARDSVAGTCFSCHMEKRGPFVRTHQPAEDCTICHNPHGTVADNLLKVRPPFLCQQCHEPSRHRGGVPNLNAATRENNVAITAGRACLNCHTNLHGTNNPADVAGERAFRR